MLIPNHKLFRLNRWRLLSVIGMELPWVVIFIHLQQCHDVGFHGSDHHHFRSLFIHLISQSLLTNQMRTFRGPVPAACPPTVDSLVWFRYLVSWDLFISTNRFWTLAAHRKGHDISCITLWFKKTTTKLMITWWCFIATIKHHSGRVWKKNVGLKVQSHGVSTNFGMVNPQKKTIDGTSMD